MITGRDVISIGAAYNSCQDMPARLCSWRFSFPGDVFHIPGKIECTVGLFPGEDVTLHHPQIGDSCEDVKLWLYLQTYS